MRAQALMAAELILFVVVTMGVKLVLGIGAIYLLLPKDGRCPNCDGDTIGVRDPRGSALFFRLCHIERRWCIDCARPHLARRSRKLVLPVQPELDSTTPSHA